MSETRSHTVVKCTVCKADCAAHHWMCDRVDGEWCDWCFDKTECGNGDHGEGCPTQVFNDSQSDDLRLGDKP